MADTAGWRFQEFQFDSDLDPEWLRWRKVQQRNGGRAARELRDMWEQAVLARVELTPELERMEPPFLSGASPAPVLRKLTLALVRGCYAVEIHVKVWTGAWETVMVGSLSYQQAVPFLERGKLRAKNYDKVLPVVIRHCVYTDAHLLGRPELRCLLAGKLP
ncbi:MAG: hypothetical protein FJW34_15055, partial [Acidobacteria bacterium]|nr:hypothetical protein [Acidobacteriota bacterium]